MKKLFNMSVAVGMALLTSCNDDFLELLPETEIAVDNFFNTEEDLSIYINGLYSFPGFEMYYGDEGTDNTATTGNREIKTVMATNANSSTITSGWDWDYLRSVNLFLEHSASAEVSPEILEHYNGVARFFRAQFYMEKIKRYSDVPWYDKVLSADSEDLYKASDPRETVVEKVFEDYQYAIDHVMAEQPSGAVDKWTVLAYAARNALFEGSFRKYHRELELGSTAHTYLALAVTYSGELIDQGRFAIHNTGRPGSDYLELFTSADLTGNPEVIFANLHIANVKNSGAWAGVFGNYEMSPARDLMESYLMADGNYLSSVPGYGNLTFVEEFTDRDPRLGQTYAHPGWELVYVTNYSSGAANYVQQLNKNFTGYHQIKGFVNSLDEDFRNGVDVPVMRYAEVLLTHAEAHGELGTLSQGILDVTVNALRKRAGMPDLTMSVPTDPVQAARYPGLSDAVLLEIRRERRVELALEGRRLEDLNRWNAGKLMEKEPLGLYFPGLGKYDMTGDGIEDLHLLGASQVVPNPEARERNSLGVTLLYYRAGTIGQDVDVYLTHGNSGHVVATPERGIFTEPRDYYRPIPAHEVTLNPKLVQPFDWK